MKGRFRAMLDRFPRVRRGRERLLHDPRLPHPHMEFRDLVSEAAAGLMARPARA